MKVKILGHQAAWFVYLLTEEYTAKHESAHHCTIQIKTHLRIHTKDFNKWLS